MVKNTPYKVISYLTYPALWATVGTTIIAGSEGQLPWAPVVILSLLCHSLLPLIFVALMVKYKKFESIEIPNLQHRRQTAVAAMASAILFSALIYATDENSNYHLWNQLILLSLWLQWLFNKWNFKISIHVLSFSAFALFLDIHKENGSNGISFREVFPSLPEHFFLYLFVVGAALIGFARHKLKAHNLAEILIAALMGASLAAVNESLWSLAQ